jgi:hypothetical protein
MEDSSVASVAKDHKTDSPIPLGMGSFNANDRQQFGRNIRLAMACIEGPAEPIIGKAMPSNEAAIHQRLKVLSQDITSAHADLLELLVRFDDLEGWKTQGAKHCAAWMNLELGISKQLGWEYLRVGRKLRLLPTTTALFRAGKLSWSKIRSIVDVADPGNEKILCHAALDASVTEVVRLCNEYQWTKDENGDGENDRAIKQWKSRSLFWNELGNGSTRIQLILPPEIAQAFLNSVEHSLSLIEVDDSDNKISQRRADAAVLMAETSLQAAGRDMATADRYQVIVSVGAADLATPPKRPTIKGAGPIARETARRIACDCSISTHTTTNGEPTDIGRRSRLWPNAMARAIRNRDQHCQFYGCTQTHNLQIHHIKHWADGGTTCVSNGVSICQKHHTFVHEGGFSIQPVANSEQRLNDQFSMQQQADNPGMFNVEKELRNDRESFNTVRKLSPTKYRFRVVDADGQDLRSKHSAFNVKSVITSKPDATNKDDVQFESKTTAGIITEDDAQFGSNADSGITEKNEEQFASNADLPFTSKPMHPFVSSYIHSTRVDCAEPVSGFYYYRNRAAIHGCGDDGALRMGRSAISRVFNHSAYSTTEKRNVYKVSPLVAH